MLSDIFTQDGMDFGLATSGNDSITMSRLPADQLSYFDSSPLTDAIALLEGDDYVINNGNPRIFYGNQGNDTAIGGAGSETLFGGQNNDSLNGDSGDDILFGNKDNDNLIGGFGNDSLYGGQGNDVVVGGAGNDTVSGDRDLDTLTGEAGADEFLLASSGSDRDVITDFEPGIDKLRAPSGVTTVTIRDLGTSILILNNGGETLATLNNLEPLDIDVDDFIGVTEVVYDPPTPPGGPDDGPNEMFERQFAQLVNQERAQIGLQPLEFESLLSEAARTHSTNMALQDFYDHTGLDGSSFTDRVEDTGFLITGTSIESIGAGYATPEKAIEMWMNTPETRESILNPDYTEIGVGHYLLNNDTGNVNSNHYWTAVFHDGEPEESAGIDIYDRSPLDGFESEEVELYNLINEYRAENNLPSIPASKALTTVANRHVLDLGENIGEVTHSWSDAPYNASDPNTWSNMWTAPQRFDTGYPGDGYENVTGYSGFDGPTMTAEEALESWKNSPDHNAVILNQGQWADNEWNALGVGLYEGYGVLWFGEEVDPTGTPDGF